jgi:hypothetical protein
MPILQTSGVFAPGVIADIQAKADSGLYAIRGFGTLRERRWATFDDLTFLPCSLTRIPLEGYREKCSTKTVLGTRFAKKPIELDMPPKWVWQRARRQWVHRTQPVMAACCWLSVRTAKR